MTEDEKLELHRNITEEITSAITAYVDDVIKGNIIRDVCGYADGEICREGNRYRGIMEAYGESIVTCLCHLFQEHFNQEEFYVSDEEFRQILSGARADLF